MAALIIVLLLGLDFVIWPLLEQYTSMGSKHYETDPASKPEGRENFPLGN